MYYLQLAILGIVFGCIYALSATGIVVTYSATGVFNIAHFAIGLLAAFCAWQMNGIWGVPLAITVPVVVAVCGPLLGLVLERIVFRPLDRRAASGSERLVASLGVTVIILAVINVVWGAGAKGTFEEPVPRLFPTDPIEVGSLVFDVEQIGTTVLTLLLAGGVYVAFRHTMAGVRFRAVVDRRELAQLTAIDADRVARMAWMLGCTLSVVAGLVLTQGALDPNKIIFLGIETFSVAVVARLRSIPVAVAFGFVVMGLGRGLLDAFAPFGADGTMAEIYRAVVANLSSLVLFAALLVVKGLDEVGVGGNGALLSGFRPRPGAPWRRAGAAAAALVAVAVVPFVFEGADLRAGQRFLALAVIFCSIVVITGFSGHLNLGQSSIAGLGAFASARFANAFDLPVLVAMVPGVAVAVAVGFVAAYPALKRRGLFLGLSTLGLAVIIDRFVFNGSIFRGGAGGLTIDRPSLLGVDLTGDRAYFFFAAAVLALVLGAAHAMRTGPLGRVLAAMRDSEAGAQSIGIGLRGAKLFVFSVSSAMAGLGGAMLAQADGAWDTVTFNPVIGLFWFTAVVVCGLTSLRGALLAAALYVFVPHVLGLDVGSAVGVFGLGAVLIGSVPGGLVAWARAALAATADRYRHERRRELRRRSPASDDLVPSEFAAAVLSDGGRQR